MFFKKLFFLTLFIFFIPQFIFAQNDDQTVISKIMRYDNLNSAIQAGNLEEFRKIAQKNPDQLLKMDAEGKNSIHIAITYNQFDILKSIVEDFGISPRLIIKHQKLTTHLAAFYGDDKMLDYLLNKHLVPIDKLDSFGMSPLDWAIFGAKARNVDFILKNNNKERILSQVKNAKKIAVALLNYKSDTESANIMQMIILQKILAGDQPTMTDILYNLEDIVLILNNFENDGP